ncbi:MAG TPA: PAS domain-containing protein [Alphaproteobacteria bacterium]|nr:PAS domain-containing protein [Alphaproteobacteria bacterium]
MSWRDLLAYWRSKHVGGVPPSRKDLDPVSEIPKLVRSLMLVDFPAEGYRFRLVGSYLAARAGRDGTGKLVTATPSPPSVLDPWIAAIERAAQTKEPQLMRSHLAGGGSVLTLLLPLVGANGSTEMILGGVFAEGAGEGFWQPISIERVDIEALVSEGRDAGQPVGEGRELGLNWTPKYQT